MKTKHIIFLLIIVVLIVWYLVHRSRRKAFEESQPQINILEIDYDKKTAKVEFKAGGQTWVTDYKLASGAERIDNQFQPMGGFQLGIWTDPNAYGGNVTAIAIAPDMAFDLKEHFVRKEIFWAQKKIKDIPRQ